MNLEDFHPNSPEIIKNIKEIITLCGYDPNTFDSKLMIQLIQTSLRFLIEEHDTGQLKLITRAVKELRYAFNVFNQYPEKKRISIFGSARTCESHPNYLITKKLSERISESNWMCITGAANGIMKAGLEGSKAGGSFGLSIRLPFEIPINEVIESDPKHILFRFFFTRKLVFLSQCDAVAVLPGGFGTMDELFEVLTLIQTGKANIVPVILLEQKGGAYWRSWEHYINEQLLANGLVSSEDQYLYKIFYSADDAVNHILHFYHRFHSYRYVDNLLVIRLNFPLTKSQLNLLNKKYSSLVVSGLMYLSDPLKEEDDHLDLSRLVFHFNRRNFGILRTMIDEINAL